MIVKAPHFLLRFDALECEDGEDVAVQVAGRVVEDSVQEGKTRKGDGALCGLEWCSATSTHATQQINKWPIGCSVPCWILLKTFLVR